MIRKSMVLSGEVAKAFRRLDLRQTKSESRRHRVDGNS
jgi:hypothetical protein